MKKVFGILLLICTICFAQAIVDEPCEPPFGEFPPVYDGTIFGNLGDILKKSDKYGEIRTGSISEFKNDRIGQRVVENTEQVVLKFIAADNKNRMELVSGMTTCAVKANGMLEPEKEHIDKYFGSLLRGNYKAALESAMVLQANAKSDLVIAVTPHLVESAQNASDNSNAQTQASTAGDVGGAIGSVGGAVVGFLIGAIAASETGPGALVSGAAVGTLGSKVGGDVGEAVGEVANDVYEWATEE